MAPVSGNMSVSSQQRPCIDAASVQSSDVPTSLSMGDEGSSATLVFYAIDSWWKEPALNIIAAAAQLSPLCHVELIMGESSGTNGEMANVLRIFNDDVGVELCKRTGRNPNYTYLSLGCSKRDEQRMLHWSRRQVGKPFSASAMARSLVWPRTTDCESWFCAELVAAALQVGGLLSKESNPGAATPASLYKLFKHRAAVTANMYTLRHVQQHASVANVALSMHNQNQQRRQSGGGVTPVSSASAVELRGMLAPVRAHRERPEYATTSAGSVFRPLRTEHTPPGFSFKLR